MFKILVLNLGGTSSKVAIYEDKNCVCDFTLRHEEEMKSSPTAAQQVPYRKELVLNWLREQGEKIENFDAIAARGATIAEAYQGGTYLVEGKYRELLLELYIPDMPLIHGNRIITPLSLSLVEGLNIPIYITDPSSVNEMSDLARVSGIKGFERRGRFHALNHRIVGRKHAEKIGKTYKEARLVVAHMGGGISIGAHQDGKVIDANDAGEGYGPFSPDRAGTVGTEVMLTLAYDRGLTRQQVFRMVRGQAGLVSHLGTADLKTAEAMARDGDKYADLIVETLYYQIAKEIGFCAAVLDFDLDAVLLTGGMAYSERLVKTITKKVQKIAPVVPYPGEFENEALAAGAYRVLSGEEKPIILPPDAAPPKLAY
ncbi:MAG: butyrate kinase [Deltaproteobacteria bacterium]|jgi:butyrate kinase|nr:butyrate kinase [Deltaproteobacteria bacterium]